MSKLKLFLGPLVGSVDATNRKRPSARVQVVLEALEGRALLSHMSLARVHASVELAPLAPVPNLHPGPILNLVGNDHAVKSPRFYPFYTGAKRAELNAAGAFIKFDGQGNGTLAGIVAGNIIAKPTSPSQEAYYVFGINRGGATNPGPFPGRPGITFDATVTVAVLQTGVSGEYKDLNTGQVSPIPADAIQINGDNIHITGVVTGLSLTGTAKPTIAFWASSGPASAGPTAIASFAPEFRGFPVVVGPWVKPHR